MKLFGPDLRRREALSLTRQFLRVLRPALGWSIPPLEAYQYGVVERPEKALEYLYGPETGSFHNDWNRQGAGWPADVDLLADKLALAERMEARGIPVVRSLACLGTGEIFEPDTYLSRSPAGLFCKARHGFAGIGAFEVSPEGVHPPGRTLGGLALADLSGIRDAWRALSDAGDVLVQPLLQNHPELAALSADGGAITLRLITCRREDAILPFWSALYCPLENHEIAGGRNLILLPVRVADGAVLAYPESRLLLESARKCFAEGRRRLAANASVPEWSSVVEYSVRAHKLCSYSRAIAWDWVITPDGPVVLEGNAYWGLEEPQISLGGFLSDGFRCQYP